MPKRALITGVNGQDGAYLSKLLLEKGYEVFGAHRRTGNAGLPRLAELGIEAEVRSITFDLLESSNVHRLVEKVAPDEVYNLAGQSLITLSFEQPVYTGEADAIGVARLLDAIHEVAPDARFLQASTSEMFGHAPQARQNEETPFHPRNPYGIAKLYGHWMTVNYREVYGAHNTSAITFNHESPLRGTEFVTRKITASLALLRHGGSEPLSLGNMESRRDWGFAGDYVEGMWRMVQEPVGDDYVLATGETHSVREFVEIAAVAAGFRLEWKGEGTSLHAVDHDSGRTLVRTDPAYYRPNEQGLLVGDAAKARARLGWSPTVSFESLVRMMIVADLDRVGNGLLRL